MKPSRLQLPALFLLLLSFTFVSCGKDHKLIRDVRFENYVQDADNHALLEVDLDLGNVQLPSVTIPIINPMDPSAHFGDLIVQGGFGGLNDIAVDINVTLLIQKYGSDFLTTNPTLPDGSPVPIGGLQGSQILQIPIDGGKHYIYLAYGQGVALAGFAVTFSALDGLGDRVAGADLLLPFKFDKLRGAGGIFTSKNNGGSGFALFADIGAYMSPSDIQDIKMDGIDLASATSTLSVEKTAYAVIDQEEYDRSRLKFEVKKMSSGKKKKLDDELYKMHKKKKKLKLN